MNRVTLLLVPFALLCIVTACRSGAGDPPPTATPTRPSLPSPTFTVELPTETPTPTQPDIVDTLENTPTLSTVLEAASTLDLREKLHSDGPFTLFAPTNSAFANLPTELQEDEEAMMDLLLYHIVAGVVSPGQLTAADSLVPLLGDEAPLTLSHDNDASETVYIENYGDGVALNAAPIQARNGLIYPIDVVLLPPSVQTWMTNRSVQSTVPSANAALPGLLDLAEQYPELSTLRDGWDAAGLLQLLGGDGPFTLFAPTDTAFATLVDMASEELLFQLDTEPTPYLLYLIVPAYVPAAALQDGLVLETEQGDTIGVRHGSTGDAGAGEIQLYSSTGFTATIATGDLPARNGILHIVDGVLLPDLQATQPITP